MSEQSPWGSPPPSSPSSPPPYQSGGTPPYQPPYQPPSGGGYGAPPSYGGPSGPGGHQRPRRNTGLIIGIVAAALVVVAAFVVTLVVTTGSDDPDEAATDNPTSEPTSETTSETTTGATSDPPPDPGANTIVGDGYQFEIPAAGWNDASDRAAELGGTIDTIIVLGKSIETAQSNILVEALSAGVASELEDLEDLWKRNLSSTDNATPVDIEDIEIDGERAIGVTIDDRLNANGDPIKQVAYLALHEGNQYSIGLSFPAKDDVVSEPDFQKVLESWTWTS